MARTSMQATNPKMTEMCKEKCEGGMMKDDDGRRMGDVKRERERC